MGPLPSQEEVTSDGNSILTSTDSTTGTPSTSGEEVPSENRLDNPDSEHPQILLAIRVDESSLDRNEWLEWLKTVPVNARDIHVEGRWDSFSTLLLLRMPVEVWNLLPENPAYSFVGFVKSENLATSDDSSESKIPSTIPQTSVASTPKSKGVSGISLDVRSGSPVRHRASVTPRTFNYAPSPPIPPNFDQQHTQTLPMTQIHHRARRVANIRENMRKAVLHLGKSLDQTEADTLWEKVLFICGVFNILISGYIIGGCPQYFHYWYTGQLLYLLPIRCFTFYERGFQFFLADLCYVVNILCMCTIWLFPRSTRLFIGTYCLAFGNNAISLTMWRSLMVFHSLDKVTTVFIHVMPCVALHCLVHLIPQELLQERFPAIWAIKMLAPSLRMQDSLLALTIWASVPYFIWQMAYYVMITVRQREQIAAGYPTSFTWLRKRYAQAPIGRIMLSLPRTLQEPAFMMLQYIYIVVTSLPCLLWFWHRYASAAFLIAVFFGSVYNGATFYSEIFRKWNKYEEESE